MAHANSLVSVLALSVAGATTFLVACSAASDGGSSTPPGAVTGTGGFAAPGVGGAAVGTGGTTSVVTGGGAAPAAGNAPAVTGTGGTVPVTGGGATPSIGGAPPAGTGGTIAGGGVPSGGSPGTAGTTGNPGNPTNWDPKANLDANGVLIPPAQDAGFQILTPTFTLQPGQEVFNCFHVQTPNDQTFAVGEWDSQMSPGSHHFILYRSDTDATASAQGVLTNPGCTQGFGGDTWLYTMGSPRGHLPFPDGVAMELTAHEKIDFDMHYINTTSESLQAHIALNVNKVKAAMYQKADAEISFNVGIAVPPMGTQTVTGTCPNVPGANYFLFSTHMHKHGTDATIAVARANGMMEQLVHTTNWDAPDAKYYSAPPFLTLQGSDHFVYTCSYKNDSSQTVFVGTSAATNEMCMMETYFFPASGTAPRCN